MEEKIKYLANFLSTDVGVVLRKAHIADGLFELRGFDFGSYKAGNAYRLIWFLNDGKPKLGVLNREDKIDYWLDDDQLLKYMHLLEHSITANPQLAHAFNLCRTGQAKAIKLFFNKKLEIDYSKTQFPKVYRDVFNAHNVHSKQRNLVMPSLNYLLIGVSLNYVPLSDSGEDRICTHISVLHDLRASDSGEDRICTHISVLHDLRALESLKNNLPQVYSEISKGAFTSEAGRFYLLDSIEDQSHV